ncbi:MAG TPA: ATP-binding cassette domain-containing protein, partial [Thermoanaerobaculia bacterium]|nr:ATP-binding cassette domain-containing protein [Thermoanaerobaculia bacterium]
MTAPAIRFDGVTKRWDGREDRPALQGFSLAVARGETLCLVGTSGSGKTTALKLVNRLLEATSGRVFVDE